MLERDFKNLTADERMSYLWNDAVMIGRKETSDSSSFLFQVGSFYVEAVLRNNDIGENAYVLKLEHMTCFHSPSSIGSYLEQVDISDLDGLLS
jgi:hypothetical protein